ncbi:serine/threonine protein kinase [Bradymonas sediminis]|nr:serine/threonine protein kinase [Bradymonas sediminis]
MGEEREMGGGGPQNLDVARAAGGHYCAECMAIAAWADATCGYCQTARPAAGWAALESAQDPWLGRIVGRRYRVTRRIATGMVARVYEAESLHIPRKFALKIVDFGANSGAPNPEVVRARLGREISAMSRLQNPHIVSIFEVLQLSEDCEALVMDYIRAPTLTELLAEVGALGWGRACQMARQIATAAHAAHEVGVVHRDLKPANIMVEAIAGGEDFIHLLDFGIVWLDDGLAITNGFVGTPLYASPEQACGGTVDPRSDVYSLGVILFEMLVGHPPFESPKIREVLRMHVRQPAPGLRESAPYRAFPPRLCQLVAKMLQKKRRERPQNLLAFIDEIDGILAAQREVHGIPRPPAVNSVAPTPRRPGFGSEDDGHAASTFVGHGVLERFASPLPRGHTKFVMPAILSEMKYNHPPLL